MILVTVGDLHYFSEDGRAEEFLRAMRDDLARKNIVPDVIAQLGDVIENQRGPSPISLEEGAAQWQFALADIKEVFPDTPFLVAPGNHDWYGGDSWFGGGGNLRRYLVPFLEKELQSRLKGALFYHVRLDGDLLLFLNHEGMESGMDVEQHRFLERMLAGAEANPAIRNVWCFAHCCLWNVNHCRFQEHARLLPYFTRCRKFRAYFAGHVHQNNITVRNAPGEQPIVQAVAAGLKIEWPREVPQEACHNILQPPPSVRQYAGIPTACHSYCVVDTDAEEMVLRYEAVGGDTIAEIHYQADGTPGRIWRTAPFADHSLPAEPVQVKFHCYAYFPERHLRRTASPEIYFNGVSAGKMPTDGGSWHLSECRSFVELPPEHLQKVNTIRITNPMRECFVLRDLNLEVTDRRGKVYYSSLYPKVPVSGDPAGIYMDYGLIHPGVGILGSALEENIPAELVETFAPGEEMSLTFSFE